MSYLSSLNIHPQGQMSLWHSGKASLLMHLKCGKINVNLKHFHLADALIQSDLQCIHGIYYQYVNSQRSTMLYKLSSRSALIANKKEMSESRTLLCPEFISVQFTACVQHISLYTLSCASPWKCVLFLLPVKATPSFLPLIWLSSAFVSSETWRGTFDTSSPSVLPHKGLLNKFSSDSICSQPVYLPDHPSSRGNPTLIWAKRQKKKKLRELWEKDTKKEK